MQKNGKDRIHNLISMALIVLLSSLFCIFVYKSQVRWDNDAKIRYTLMSAHKENPQVILTKEQPEAAEDFICRVPELNKIQIQGIATDISDESMLKVEVVGLDDGSVYYEKEAKVSSFYGTKKSKKSYKLKGLPKDTEGMVLRLRVTLITDGDTTVGLFYNRKPGTVMAFNGNPDEDANIIYRMTYGSVALLSRMFFLICGWLIMSAVIIYILIFVSRWHCTKWFPIVALLLGMAVQWVIPVYGVPDEPWHMDTAYQLANTILHADPQRQDGTVLKRECDIITADLLANDVESNSYYQLLYNSFVKPENKSMRRVAYTDAGLQVPDIVYLPAAIGIMIGRAFGLSGMMVYQLARIFSLIAYILITWAAIRLMPYCNSLLAVAAVSLIALQQAASASYDAMINAVIFLFTALCFKLAYGNPDDIKLFKTKTGKTSANKKQFLTPNKLIVYLMTIASAVFIAVVKGGVYIPVLLLIILPLKNNKMTVKKKTSCWKWICGILAASVAAVSLMLIKYYPFLKLLLSGGEVQGGERYTPGYVLKHPLEIVYMYWRTIIKSGDKYLSGLFGGVLGWHNIEIPWIFIIPIIIGLLLLVHVENERPPVSAVYRNVMLVISILTIVLVMLAMLFACTKVGRATIWGIQGRYFIPVEILMLSALSTPMITVSMERAKRIEYVILLLEMLALVQVVVLNV